MKLRNLIPLVPVAVILGTMMLGNSCANTTTAPTGGPKDTIPPSLVNVSPLPGSLHVPTSCKKTKIIFTFDEYVVIKESKNIYLSPPQEKSLKAKTQGKSVVVTFEEDLRENTTYTLDLTGAIVDNNESNPFPGFSLTFSTGEKIDSMFMTGIVQDCSTLQRIKGATVMLYKDQRDSAIFLQRPDAAVKTDDWGWFCLRNIQDTCYRLYALMDDNSNNKYDPETEKVAFIDSIITPSRKVADGIYELYKFDMLDTVNCEKRAREHELNLFRGKPSKQYILNSERVGERTAYIKFMAPDVQLYSVKFKGISDRKVFKMFNQTRDSLVMWINNPRPQPDTLFLSVDYMKTDSLGELKRTVEPVKFVKPKELRSKALKSSRKDLKHEDTIAVFKVDVKPENFEQDGITIAFDYPLVEEDFENMKYEIINIRQKTEPGKYSLERDTADIRRVRVRNVGKIQPGYEYKLTVPHRRFKDINGFYNDSLLTSVKLPDDDKLSDIKLNLTGVYGARYIIDMMDEKRSNVLRSYTVEKNSVLDFPYLKAGQYCFRITEDKNRNNLVDTGDLLSHRQPEKVRFYKLPDGNYLLTIPESTEMSQDIDIKQLFL